MLELQPNTAVVVASISATVAILLWIASRCWDLFTGWKIRHNLIRSLRDEVEYNIRELKDHLKKSERIINDSEHIKSKLETGLIPFIIDASHTAIYRENISSLHQLNEIGLLVEFYAGLDEIKSYVDGFLLPSYKTISIEGQFEVIVALFDKSQKCLENGEDLLKTLDKLL